MKGISTARHRWLFRLTILKFAPTETHPSRQLDFTPRIAALCERRLEFCAISRICFAVLIGKPLRFSHFLIASVPAGERQHFSARARVAASGAVVAISKNVPFQWRKKGGRWPMAEIIQRFSKKLASLKIK